MTPTTLGVIVGNRGFFPKHLCVSGRATILKVLESEGLRAIALDLDATPYGSVESLADAHKLADLFKANRDVIDGVLVTLPNFGDERAIANVLRWAWLNVPVLVHAFPDDPTQMTLANRRDSFCGKMSACNNLRQYGLPFTLTRGHTMDPEGEAFRADLRQFAATCRVTRGLRHARRPSTPCATARSCWNKPASPSRRSTYLKFSAGRRACRRATRATRPSMTRCWPTCRPAGRRTRGRRSGSGRGRLIFQM